MWLLSTTKEVLFRWGTKKPAEAGFCVPMCLVFGEISGEKSTHWFIFVGLIQSGRVEMTGPVTKPVFYFFPGVLTNHQPVGECNGFMTWTCQLVPVEQKKHGTCCERRSLVRVVERMILSK